ncbi:hypothetical protein NEISICOT_02112 [Neisseria sicca ATCC 29256]|uniref:Uncharacterized protein n=1 Tax=Neisseria sicca ATCC 29256 TaxID=547045 RepID=C6M6G0_NEISI|nr:hypothetical protein NEISICOT_02112 [Neisseria sicca ATCC 29256]
MNTQDLKDSYLQIRVFRRPPVSATKSAVGQILESDISICHNA